MEDRSQKENTKKRIAVLFGGASPEYEVSLQSAHAVLTHMDPQIYTPVPIGITRQGRWYLFEGGYDEIARDTWARPACCTPVAVLPGGGRQALLAGPGAGAQALCVDAAFPVLHGQNGEDGTVQGLLALAGIPTVGCGVLASALCMDKARAHRLVQAAGIAVPAGCEIRRCDAPAALSHAEKLGWPLFVKPVRAGSSFGISRVTAPAALPAALALAFRYDDTVLLEEAVEGFEVGCAVMGNEVPQAGEVDEVELGGGFFDFEEKYTLKTSAIHTPARLPEEKRRQIAQTAKTIYRALGCRGFARVDMFLSSAGELIFNEVNTIPGFTPHSRFPAMMQAAGVPFAAVVGAAIELALQPPAGQPEEGAQNGGR